MCVCSIGAVTLHAFHHCAPSQLSCVTLTSVLSSSSRALSCSRSSAAVACNSIVNKQTISTLHSQIITHTRTHCMLTILPHFCETFAVFSAFPATAVTAMWSTPHSCKQCAEVLAEADVIEFVKILACYLSSCYSFKPGFLSRCSCLRSQLRYRQSIRLQQRWRWCLLLLLLSRMTAGVCSAVSSA
jgi:hypothetical protein